MDRGDDAAPRLYRLATAFGGVALMRLSTDRCRPEDAPVLIDAIPTEVGI